MNFRRRFYIANVLRVFFLAGIGILVWHWVHPASKGIARGLVFLLCPVLIVLPLIATAIWLIVPRASRYFEQPDMLEAAHTIERDDRKHLKHQLDKGLPINTVGNKGMTLLKAILIDQDASAKALLEWGADPNLPGATGISALGLAMKRGNRVIYDALTERGAKLNTGPFRTKSACAGTFLGKEDSMARTKKTKGVVIGTLVVDKKYRVRHGSGGLNKGDIVAYTGTDVDTEMRSSTYGKTWYTFRRQDGFSFRTDSDQVMRKLDPIDTP